MNNIYPSGYKKFLGCTTVAARDNTTASLFVDAEDCEFIEFTVYTTDASADTTVDMKLQSADDTSGTNAADISGASITQFTAAATAKAARLEARQETLIGSGDTFIGALVTAGNGTVGATLVIVAEGYVPNYLPVTNDSRMVQVKSV